MSEKSQKVKIGVVGVGHLGKRHLFHLLDIDSADCVGFYDIDPARSDEIRKATGAKEFSSLEKLIQACEALSIVVPTKDHFLVGKKCIKEGRHVFIEKPICRILKEADEIIDLAKEKKVITQVGHIERLNPALLALDKIPISPKYIETHRLAPYNIRGTDVPVVLDLMIHDLDVILSLVKSSVTSVHASGVSIMTSSVDIANARLRFENGCVANITSSRIATGYVRKLRIFQQDMYVTIDFLKGLTETYRVLDANVKDTDAIVAAPLERNGMHRQIVYEKPPVRRVDALRMELENFISSVQGTTSPIVSGEEGREALRIATIIQEKISQDLH